MVEGWIPLFRQFIDPDHPIGMGEPFCPWMAWADLVAEAAHEDTRRTTRWSGTFVQPRGVVLVGSRTRAERWRWTRAKLRRFFELLKAEHMVVNMGPPNGVAHSKDGTLWRIVNYDTYAMLHKRDTGPRARIRPAEPTRGSNRSDAREEPHHEARISGRPPAEPPAEPPAASAGARPQINKDLSINLSGGGFSDDEPDVENRLRSYLGEHADPALGQIEEACTPQQWRAFRAAIETRWLPGGYAVKDWRGIPESDRTRILAMALSDFAIQHPPKDQPDHRGLKLHHFGGFIRREVAKELRSQSVPYMTAAEEQQREDSRRNSGRTSSGPHVIDIAAAMGKAERETKRINDELAERRAWFAGLSDDEQKRMKVRAEVRARAELPGSMQDRGPSKAMVRAYLTAVVEEEWKKAQQETA